MHTANHDKDRICKSIKST